MSHPFGDLLSQHLHRKHGLSQAKLAEGILQDPSIIGKMCKGQRLNGPQARERVVAIIDWLHRQAVMASVFDANQLLAAAGIKTNLPALTSFVGRTQELAVEPSQATGESYERLLRQGSTVLLDGLQAAALRFKKV